MKPILYWTLTSPSFRSGYHAFGVTSEGPRRRLNGRFEDDHPSHTITNMVIGRFKTLEEAQAKRKDVDAIRKTYYEARRPHQRLLQLLDAEEDKAIKDCLNPNPVF